eukprot:305727-Amphidinium_carterae.1
MYRSINLTRGTAFPSRISASIVGVLRWAFGGGGRGTMFISSADLHTALAQVPNRGYPGK